MIRSDVRLITIFLLVWSGAAGSVDAQTVPGQGDPTGLRNPLRGAGAQPGKLFSALTISVDGGVDDNTYAALSPIYSDPTVSAGSLFGAASSASDPQFHGVQFFSTARAGLSLSKSARRSAWQIFGGSSLRFYPGQREVINSSDDLGGSVAFPLGGRIRIQGSGNIAYSPYYSLATSSFVGAFDAPALDGQLSAQAPPTALPITPTSDQYPLLQRSAYTSAARATFMYNIGQYSTLGVFGGTQRTDFVRSTDPSIDSWDAGFRFQHQMTQASGLRLGYARRVGRFSRALGAVPVLLEDIDVGFDYTHALSKTRKTTVTFSPGLTATSDTGSRHYSVIAGAGLDRLIGRTAHLGLRYDRQVGLVGGLVRPVFMDTVSANYSASLSRRVDVAVTTAYVIGEVGQDSTTANGYQSFTGQARMSMETSSHTWLYADYLWYRHDIGTDVQLLGPIPSVQRRQSVRLGLTLQMPLRTGRP